MSSDSEKASDKNKSGIIFMNHRCQCFRLLISSTATLAHLPDVFFLQSNFQVENKTQQNDKKNKIYDREDQAQDHVICSP